MGPKAAGTRLKRMNERVLLQERGSQEAPRPPRTTAARPPGFSHRVPSPPEHGVWEPMDSAGSDGYRTRPRPHPPANGPLGVRVAKAGSGTGALSPHSAQRPVLGVLRRSDNGDRVSSQRTPRMVATAHAERRAHTGNPLTQGRLNRLFRQGDECGSPLASEPPVRARWTARASLAGEWATAHPSGKEQRRLNP